jgi:plastocyanin
MAIAGAAALVAAAPASAGSTHVKKVGVADDYYTPGKLTVARGTTVKWVWPDDASDVHDVKLAKGPKGVKTFQSEPGSAGYIYSKSLKVPGTYKIVCTFHSQEMRMTITVKR